MYYFFCPKCGKEDEVSKIPRGTMTNIRDGYGTPIYHYECPDCHNMRAGFMAERKGNDDEKKYYQHVIRIYQIHEFNNKNIPLSGDIYEIIY